MICNKCGSALPSDGMVCKQCGMMMSKEQIEEEKKWQEINKDSQKKIDLMSNKYGVNKEQFKYDTEGKKENKLLGVLIVVGVFFIVLIIALIKFFS